MRRALFILIGLLIPGVVLAGLSITATVLRSYPTEEVNVAPACSQTAAALSVASASPPALWVHPVSTQPFLIEPGANASLVGQYGIYGADAITNICQRSSFESWAAGTPTGWAKTETAGDGSAAVSEENTIVVHGGSSAKCVLTGTTSECRLIPTNCFIPTGNDMHLSSYVQCASGTCNVTIGILEYDNGNCTAFLDSNNVYTGGDPGTDWVRKEGVITNASLNGATSSFKIWLREAGDGGTTAYFDAVQLQDNVTTPTDALCSTDAAASAVCNLQDITDDNPPFDMTAGGWTFTATVRSPIDGAEADTRQILYAPATAGNNNLITISWASDVLTCTVNDSAGNAKTSTVAAAGDANTSYDVKCSKSNVGTVTACWDGTCDATPAMDALTDGIGAELIFASEGTTGGEVWVYNPKFSRGAK